MDVAAQQTIGETAQPELPDALDTALPCAKVSIRCSILIDQQPIYCVERFADDNAVLRYLTGFNSMSHINLLYRFLLPDVEQLLYKFRDISPLN